MARLVTLDVLLIVFLCCRSNLFAIRDADSGIDEEVFPAVLRTGHAPTNLLHGTLQQCHDSCRLICADIHVQCRSTCNEICGRVVSSNKPVSLDSPHSAFLDVSSDLRIGTPVNVVFAERRFPDAYAVMAVVCFLSLGSIVLLIMFSHGTLLPEDLPDGIGTNEFTYAIHSYLDSIDFDRLTTHIRGTDFAHTSFRIYTKLSAWIYLVPYTMICLAAIARPGWCEKAINRQPGYEASVANPCYSDMYPSWPIEYMGTNVHVTLDFCLVSIISTYIGLSIAVHGKHFFGLLGSARMIAATAYTAEILYRFWFHRSILGFYLAPYWRVFFALMYSQSCFDTYRVILKTIQDVLPLSALTVLVLLIFSWTATAWLNQVPSDIAEFKDLQTSAWNLFSLLNGNDYPDLMMPAYNETRFHFIFFLAWTVSSCFFLVPMSAAVVYSSYVNTKSQIEEEVAHNKKEGRNNAFIALQGDGDVSKHLLCKFVETVSMYTSSGITKSRDVNTWMDGIGDDHKVTKEEFDTLLDLLAKGMDTKEPPPLIESLIPSLTQNASWLYLRHIYNPPIWPDAIVDTFICLDLIFLVFDADIAQKDVCEYVFCIIFVVDMLVRWIIHGFLAYWMQYKNVLDFALTVMMVLALVAEWLKAYAVGAMFEAMSILRVSRFLRAANVLRACRCLRIFMNVPEIHRILVAFQNAMPSVRPLFKVMVITMYLFAVSGVQMFGGVINTDPGSRYYALLKESRFAEGNYWANSFNDVPSAFVVLYELAVVNSCSPLVEGYTLTCGTWARLYFVSYWWIGSIICLNILVALFVDVVVQQKTALEEEEQ